MKKSFRKVYLTTLTVLFAMLFSGCEDPELDALMADYCDCISESRYDETKQMECVEKMDSITSKYEGQPRKIKTVLDKTDECY
ncbi:MAG TPA: hypothetical protein VKY37_05035 [Brumimicrobium sp.]|nr:hypothetical protein [Brumimicrobium sp.]